MDMIIKRLDHLLALLTTPAKLTQNERLLILNLPQHLVKTYFTLQHLEHATAEDVAAITHKQRAVESGYINQLCVMGLCIKERVGRKVMFSITKNKHQTQ
jgi:hypothetical protein